MSAEHEGKNKLTNWTSRLNMFLHQKASLKMYKDIRKDRGDLSSAFLSRDTNPQLFHIYAVELVWGRCMGSMEQ